MTAAEPRAPGLEPQAGGHGWLTALRAVGRALGRWPRALAAAVALSWMALIWSLSAQPGADGPGFPGLGFVANLAHAPLFGLLALWLALALPRTAGWPRLDGRGVALVLGLVLCWAVTDEWHQSHVARRSPSAWDVGTDLCGAAATLLVGAYAGLPGARESGVQRRLLIGLAACAVAAGLATWVG